MIIDAENIMIPYLRAKFDGDPIHDRITWILQKETEMGQTTSATDERTGEVLVKTGDPVEKTYIIGLLDVQGIMFHVKEEVPPLMLTTQQACLRWCDNHHLRLINALNSQILNFIGVCQDVNEELNRLLYRATSKDQ